MPHLKKNESKRNILAKHLTCCVSFQKEREQEDKQRIKTGSKEVSNAVSNLFSSNSSMAVQVQTVLTSPLKRAQATAQTISRLQSLAGSPQPKVQVMDELTNRALGGWEGRHALEVWATLKNPRSFSTSYNST